MKIRWWLIVLTSFLLGLLIHLAVERMAFHLDHYVFSGVKNSLFYSMKLIAGWLKMGYVGSFAKQIAILIFLLALLPILVYLLLDATRPWKYNRETVIQFMDLRPNLEKIAEAGRLEKSDELWKSYHLTRHRSITELFAAKLRQIISIHDLAYQYCRIHFRNQEIFSSRTCVDMTSVWSQVEIKSLFFEEPNRLAIGASPFNDDLGQISSKVGPVEASFSLNSLMQFLQSRKPGNIYISGSLQDHGDGPCVVAQLAFGKQSWAWDMDYEKIRNHVASNQLNIPSLLNQLAYHATNRIMGQSSQLIDVLPGDHFEIYSQLLSRFVEFIQSNPPGLQNQEKRENTKKGQVQFSTLTSALQRFLEVEPSDLRSYYMLYIVGIIAIGREDYKLARDLLTEANHIEPSVVASILRTGLSLKRLKWRPVIAQALPSHGSGQQRVSRADRIRAMELARGLANVNAALGFSLEHSLQSDGNLSFLEVRLRLEESAAAYQRAFDYKSDDPLFLSNQAEVKLKLSDLLQPKDMYLDQRLRLRTEAQKLLRKACRMKKNEHLKYAWLRLGHDLLRRGDLRQAEDFFKRAWDADHNFLVAARNLANCYSIQGDPDRAIQICNQALHVVGENRTQYLLTQQIHAWIHNSRGWAYLRMVIEFRKKRLSNPLQVADCESWLLMAQQNFEEAIRLIRKSQGDGKGQESIPMINQLFVVWEKQLLENGFLEDDVLASLHSTLEEMPRGDHFTMIYHSLLSPSSDNFSGIFRHFWMNHSFVPSEYLGLIADVQLLKEYLGLRFAVAPLAEQIILQNTHKNLDEGLEVIHANLPSCFLGLHYLWSGHPERAVKCWRKRLQNLRQVSDYAKFQSLNDLATTSIDVTPAALNHELWMYLYAGLSAMFSGESDHDLSSGSLPLIRQAAVQSAPNRQYALDLLTEAREICEILMERSPKSIYHNKDHFKWPSSSQIRGLFRPVHQAYFHAVKHQILRSMADCSSDVACCIRRPVARFRRTVKLWFGVLFSF